MSTPLPSPGPLGLSLLLGLPQAASSAWTALLHFFLLASCCFSLKPYSGCLFLGVFFSMALGNIHAFLLAPFCSDLIISHWIIRFLYIFMSTFCGLRAFLKVSRLCLISAYFPHLLYIQADWSSAYSVWVWDSLSSHTGECLTWQTHQTPWYLLGTDPRDRLEVADTCRNSDICRLTWLQGNGRNGSRSLPRLPSHRLKRFL